MKTVFWVIIICGLFGMWYLYEDANYDPVAEARIVQDKINEYRIEAEVGQLTWDYRLEKLAIAHSQYMQDTGHFQHSKHPYYENILEGEVHPEKIAELWKESPAHYSIMISEHIRSGAVGVVGNYATFMAR